MNSSLKSTILTVAATVIMSVAGGWLAGAKQQTTHTVKIEALEEQIGKLDVISQREVDAETRITTLEVQAKTAFYQIGRIDTAMNKYDDKIQNVQISSAKITSAIEQFTIVVRDLSIQTNKLSEVVSRLDERVKDIEEENDNGVYKRSIKQPSRSHPVNGG